jgi:hypothetical protein
MNELIPRTCKGSLRLILALLVLSALVVSGFTGGSGLDQQTGWQLPPSEGAGAGSGDLPNTGAGDDEGGNGDGDGSEPTEPVDVITNGKFEKPWEDNDGVAPDWEGFSNGQAHIGWYEELWPEAVRPGGIRAQLMEIFEVEPNILDRVVAIFQTVNVAPNATYELTIHAILRTQVQPADRNKNEFEMAWGIDYSGTGDYENVEEWHIMPLEEQFRLGSNGEFPDDVPLFYQEIVKPVETRDGSKISLFIRGLKKFPTGAEVNFDVDDVSLKGPPPGVIVIITPEPDSPQPETPAPQAETMPETGLTLSENVSPGALVLGSLVLVVLGATATANLLKDRKEP